MNNKILKDRWGEVDELLSTFLSNNRKINRRMYDNIQSVLDGIKFSYEEIYDYASDSDIRRLRNKIEDLKEQYGLTGYIGYELDNYSKEKKLQNKDLLLALLMIEYYKQNEEQKKEEEKFFDEVCTMVYHQAYTEAKEVLEPKKKKIKVPPFTNLHLILASSLYNNFDWIDYKEGVLGYNVKNLFTVILILMQLGKELNIEQYEIKKTLQKQEKSYLYEKQDVKETEDIEEKEEYKDFFIGAIDNYMATLANKATLEAIKDAGCQKVQFIAELDENTTKMCRSLDGQIFNIYEYNIYYRYSDVDKKEVKHKTYGLITGENLPPINNHFHWCRSTIYPYK